MSRRRRKFPGHYCWACDSRRSNEAFSRRSRLRGVCKRCLRLGPAELAYRQAVRDITRCFTYEGFLRRKARRTFERFLEHECERVRAYAAARLADDRRLREEHAAARLLDERMVEFFWDERAEPVDPLPVRLEGVDVDDDIPF